VNGKKTIDKKTGRVFAAHGEKIQAYLLAKAGINRPIGINKQMCGDCRNFFRAYAKYRKETITTIDPMYIRKFHADGTVDIYDKNGNHLRQVGASVKPEASAYRNYEGIMW